MAITVPLLVFMAVSCLAFAAGVLLDQRRARARLIRERLSAEQSENKRGETLALLRDEMFSRIPAFDTLLRRSERVSKLQTLLEQAGAFDSSGKLADPLRSQRGAGGRGRLHPRRPPASE